MARIDAEPRALPPIFVPADGPFTEWHQPDTVAREDGLYVLRRNFHVELPDGDVLLFERPPIKQFDGISVPGLVWRAGGVRPGGRCRAGATAHDGLYLSNGLIEVLRDGKRVWRKLTRRESDWVFNWLMKRPSARRWYRGRCWYCWVGVRSPGGWVAWQRHWLRNRKDALWKARLLLARDEDKRPPVWEAADGDE